ncbi:MAG: MFS transporter [Lachnospiraceae bacterium]|nr:MFS transporter [Lachnospiraceae bacterium]
MTDTVKKDRGFWTLRYTIINMTYYMAYCGIHGYTAVFLLDKGFSNTLIGIDLALANILSVIFQPIVAGIIDKQGKLTNRITAMISTALIILGCIFLLIRGDNKAAVFIVFALIYMIQMVYQPVITAMNFEYSMAGCKIYFGLARGLGSVSFAVASFFVGRALGTYGVKILMILVIFVLSIGLVALYFFKKPEGGNIEDENVKESIDQGMVHNNIIDFTRTYPKFMLFVLGSVFFFFSHNALNDYLLQIITPIGGDEASLGRAIFLAAILELPTMALINKVMEKIPLNRLLIFSGISFTIKTLIMMLAFNMGMVYLSQFMQMFAYAVFIPGSAYYVNMVMDKYDQVKGQAYVNCSITLGGVFSSLICGRILDVAGTKAMLAVSLIVSAAGLLIVLIALSDKDLKSKTA